jgi:hypothetical protein
MLSDHYEGTRFEVDPLDGPAAVTPLCRHATSGEGCATTCSVIAQLPQDIRITPVFWVALGPPCISVHLPVVLGGDLPAAYACEAGGLWSRMRQLAVHNGKDARRWLRAREALGRLQTRFEQDMEEFLAESASLKRSGAHGDLSRLAGSLMQSHVERFEETLQSILGELSGPFPKEYGNTAELLTSRAV